MEKILKLFTYVDGTNDTPFPSADEQVIIGSFTYTANRMGGAPHFSATVKHRLCLDDLWSDKVYATFNGEKYFVINTPSSSKSNDDTRYEHDLELLSEREILNHVYFIDAVQGDSDTDVYKSNSTKVLFYGDIQQFVARLNASLSYRNLGYTAVIDDGITSEDKQVSFEDKYILEALQEEFNIFEIPYYFVGKVIHFGYTSNAITTTFKYGHDDAFLSISKDNANYALINRITGVGSSDNIPYYYPNETDDQSAVEASGKKWITPSQNLMPSIYRESEGAEMFYEAKNNTYPDGEGGYYQFENEYSGTNPREGKTNFEDIKPTITGITNAAGQRIDMFSEFAYDTNDNDEVDEEGNYLHPYFFAKLRKTDGTYGFNLFDHAIESQTMQITFTSGICGACTFEIAVGEDTQKNLVQVGETSGALMRDEDGNVLCGREDLQQPQTPQDRQNDTKNYEVWIALRKDNSTYPQVMPNVNYNYKPSTSDTFAILGISLPQAYILKAEDELEKSLVKHMWMNNVEKFTFSAKFSRIFFTEHPEVLAQLNENARVIIEYNGKQHTLYIDNYSYKMDASSPLPEIDVDLVDTLSVGQNSLQTQLDSVKQDILSSMGGGDFLKTGLKYFLRKDTADTARGKITFVKGIDIGTFSQNAGGGTFRVLEDLTTYAEVDRLRVRVKAYFETLEIINTNSVGGKMILTAGGGVYLREVKDRETLEDGTEQVWDFYRCYFLTEQDGREVENRFHVGDLAMSQSFNIKAGTHQGVTNHYYWREVVGIGDDYIDLSKTICDTGSDAPMAEDTVCHLGNRSDKDRQGAIIFSAVDVFSPSITLYYGINDFSLVNKDYVSYGVDKSTGNAFFRVYGEMYAGDREQTSYVKYTPGVGVEMRGKFLNQAGESYDTIIDSIQNAIDGNIETWFGEEEPTLSNEPAVNWTTDEDKNSHLGDLYYSDAGVAYRFQMEGANYVWKMLKDSDITKALADAKAAKDAADAAQEAADAAADRLTAWASDGVISPTEKQGIKDEIARIDADKANITAQYTKYGLGTPTAFNNAYTAYRAVLVSLSASTPENIAIPSDFSSKQTYYYNERTSALGAIADASITSVNNVTEQLEQMQQEFAEVKEDVAGVKTSVDGLKNFTDEAFADGIVDRNESAAIASHINSIETFAKDAAESYTKVYENALLTGTAKTNLANAYTAFTTAKTELVTTINGAISDGLVDALEKSAVDGKYTAFNTKYGDFVANLNAANRAIQDAINKNALQALQKIGELDYLKAALKEFTTIDGGLIQSSTLALGYTSDSGYQVMAGTNGIYDASKLGGGIASWWGGAMFDRFEYTEETMPENVASALVRMDGTGYFAKGNLWWESDGTLHADPLSFFVGKETVGDVLGLFQFVKSDAGVEYVIPQHPFQKLEIGNYLQIGKAQLYWDEGNKAFYVRHQDGVTPVGFYATGFISAKGANPNAGGAVSGASSLDELSDVALSNIQDGQVLAYDTATQKWVNKSVSAGGLDETALAEYLTDNGYATQGWATSQFAYKTGTNASGTWPISVTGLAGRLSSTYTGNGGNQPPSYFNGMGLKVNMMSVPVQYSDVIVVNGYNGIGADVPYINAIAFQKTANAHGEVYHARAGYGASSWGTWYPFIDSYNIGSYNAGSATKLQTAQTIWGRPFDGTAPVSGNMTGVGSITMNGNVILTASTSYIHGSGAIGISSSGSNTVGVSIGADGFRPLLVCAGQYQLGVSTNRWGKFYGTSGDFSGSLKIGSGTISWDATNNCFHFSHGLYSDSFVSAKGANSGSGGTVSGVTKLSDLSDVQLGTLATNQVLSWNGSKWVNKAISTGLDETALAQYLTNNQYLTMPTGDGRYALKGGSNATGTWPISVTSEAGWLDSHDTRDVNNIPGQFQAGARFEFKSNSTDGLNDGVTYHGILHFKPYGSTTDFSGGPSHQLGFTHNGNLWMRTATSLTAWGAWYKLLHTGNYASTLDSRYVKKTGDTMTGTLTVGKTGGSDALLVKQNGTSAYAAVVGFGNDGGMLGYLGVGGSGSSTGKQPFFTPNLSSPLYTLLHSNNYTNYTVTKTGSGASGTWPISISGSAAQLGGLTWSNFRVKRIYSISLSSLPTTNFYPIFFGAAYRELDCEINSPNLGDAADYNNNRIHFLISSAGWSDNGYSFVILSRNNYSDSEITIGAIGYGQRNGGVAVWVRGGMSYTVIANQTPSLKTSNYTNGEEIYTVGTNIYGGTNTYVSLAWQNTTSTYRHSTVVTNNSNPYFSSSIKIGSGTISWDATNNCFHFSHGLYSDSFVSAKGANSGSGGTVSGVTKLSDLSDVQLGTLATNQVLSWNGSKWVNKTLEAGLDETALAQYLTNNQYLTMPTGDGRYALKGGSNATGTWPISITGNAATATKLSLQDTRSVNTAPFANGRGLIYHFKYNTADGLNDGGTYHSVLQFNQWDESSGGLCKQLALTDGGNMWFRNASSATAWGAWKKLLDSSNYSSIIGNSFVKKAGDTMTGALTVPSLAVSGSTATVSGNKVWHAGNDGSGSGLDADTLDGVHNGSVTAIKLGSTYTGNGGNQPPSYFNGMGLKVNMMSVPVQYSDVIVVNGYNGIGADVPYINAIAFQKTANAHGEVYHARAGYGASSWGTWYPFIDSYNIGSYNAGSATKLQTAQTIWGRPFDGTAPVSGNMTGVGSITGSGSISMSGSITAGAYVYSSGWFQNQQSGEGLYNSAVDARWYATSGGWISDKKINANAGLAVTGAATFSSTITASGDISTTAGLIKITKNGNTTTIGSQNATWCQIYNSNRVGFIFNNKVCTTGGGSLGDTQYRWGGVYSTTGNFSRELTVSDLITANGGLTTSQYIQIGSARLMWDSETGALYVLKSDGTACGFYATGFVSAKGANGDGRPGDLTDVDSLTFTPGTSNRNLYFNANGMRIITTNSSNWATGISVYNNANTTNLGDVCGAYGGKNSFSYSYFGGSYNSPGMVILPSNKYVGIGTTSPTYKLHVSGTAYATGGFQNGSDIRYKHVLQDLALTVAQVAAAPSFLFRWTDGTADGVQAGTSAQYWQQVMPQVVTESAGRLSMQYDKAALAAAITIAREVETLEQRVDRLEKENGKLKKKVKELERRAA